MSLRRPHLKPGPSHPITIKPHEGEVVVRVGDSVVARTTDAVTLHEASYPAVFYIPLADVDPQALRDSGQHTYCPYKGEASYFDLEADGRELPGAVWYYPEPYEAVSEIAGRVAFYADRVDISS